MTFLQDQHAIAVAVEAVLFADGLRVGAEDQFLAGERADHHEQRRTGQVEVREHRVDGLEPIGRMDEDRTPPLPRLDDATGVRAGLERAHARAADGDDAASGGFRRRDGRGGRLRDLVAFRVHDVLFDFLDLDGAERAGSDMQRHEFAADAGVVDAGEQLNNGKTS